MERSSVQVVYWSRARFGCLSVVLVPFSLFMLSIDYQGSAAILFAVTAYTLVFALWKRRLLSVNEADGTLDFEPGILQVAEGERLSIGGIHHIEIEKKTVTFHHGTGATSQTAPFGADPPFDDLHRLGKRFRIRVQQH